MESKENILIVDDWDVNIEMLEAILDSLGYNTYSAMNAKDAADIISNKLPHLILLDIMMPDINGYEFCEMLKQNPKTRDIPVIFVSAAESDEEREKAFEIGGVDFIRKPFDLTEIKTRVSTHLNIYNLRRELEEKNRKLNQIIGEQSRKIIEEKKRILKNIVSHSSESDNYVSNEIIAKNSRMLAQALNFSDRYENKISESFVEAVEIGALIRNVDIKLFEVFFTEDDTDESVKTVADIVYGYNNKGGTDSLSFKIVRIADAFSYLISQSEDRDEALSKLREEEGLDPYLLDMFFRIEKQMK